MSETIDRVDFQNDELDEVVAGRGAHLERIGKDRWFLIFYHTDGTETALWFSSKDLKRPFLEKREPGAATSPADEGDQI